MTEQKSEDLHLDHIRNPKPIPLNAMESGRTDRDSDLGDDSPMSHGDDHSDREDDMRDCDSSDEGVNVNSHMNGNNGMDYQRSPTHNTDSSHLSHHTQFPVNPLGMLGNFMGVQNLQNLQNLPNMQHGDVLEKLKMQVREMKVGLMDQDFPLHSFNSLHTPPNTSFTLPPSTNHSQPQNLSQQSQNGFSFTPPNAPHAKDGNPGSNSSTSSETSNSSQQNNGWSFEEQFKQVRQLYEINDDPKRKEFLDDLFSFMQKRGTPINRLPIMAKSVLDLYELYNLVIARGGLVDVINKKLWQEIIKGLHLPSSITSAAFTLRTQYMKYLYPYECEKKSLSSPAELQAAIDGNRREGRRSSYGQFDQQMQGQLQMQRSPSGLQQMSPLSLVTHGNAPNSHHRMMGGPPLGSMTNVVPHDIEQRMIEYIKMFQTPKEPRRSQSPELLQRDALNALEMSRVALWSMYNNNTSPPVSINTISPPNHEPQREALNLAESPPHIPNIKRERDLSSDYPERERDVPSQPPQKRAVPIDKSIQRNNSSSIHNDERSRTPMNEHDMSDEPAHNSSPMRNGITNNSTSSGPTTILSGMQFKITSRGNAANGEQQLVVTMELNGVQYEGVLFANPTTSLSNSTTNSSPSKTNPNSNHNSIDDRETSRVARPLVSS